MQSSLKTAIPGHYSTTVSVRRHEPNFYPPQLPAISRNGCPRSIGITARDPSESVPFFVGIRIWIRDETGLGIRTAFRFRCIAKKFGPMAESVSALNSTVLHLMANAPAEVVAQVEAQAAAGETITASVVRHLKAEWLRKAAPVQLSLPFE